MLPTMDGGFTHVYTGYNNIDKWLFRRRTKTQDRILLADGGKPDTRQQESLSNENNSSRKGEEERKMDRKAKEKQGHDNGWREEPSLWSSS